MAEKIFTPLVEGTKIQLQKNVEVIGASQLVEPDEGFTSMEKVLLKNLNPVVAYYDVNSDYLGFNSWNAYTTNAYTNTYYQLLIPIPKTISSQIAAIRNEDINSYVYGYTITIEQSRGYIKTSGSYFRTPRGSTMSRSTITSLTSLIPSEKLQTFSLTPTASERTIYSTSSLNTTGLTLGKWSDIYFPCGDVYIPLTTKYHIFCDLYSNSLSGYGFNISLQEGFHEGRFTVGLDDAFGGASSTSTSNVATVPIPSNC